jgi:hypothetical protein
MRITEEYVEGDTELLVIQTATYIGDYAIRILFNDGLTRLVDFKQFLESSLHPSIRKYLNEEKFKGYSIVDGNLNWNDYDLIFPIADLYEGKL